MTEEQIAEIEARFRTHEGAAWYDLGDLAGLAREDIPALIAEVRRLRSFIEDAAGNAHITADRCPGCADIERVARRTLKSRQ